jgi:hypothetical protein
MTLKAWGWVRGGGTPALLRGLNVASVGVSGSATAVNFTAAMASADYVVRLWASNNATGIFPIASGQTAAGFFLSSQTTAQSNAGAGSFYFEVWE